MNAAWSRHCPPIPPPTSNTLPVLDRITETGATSAQPHSSDGDHVSLSSSNVYGTPLTSTFHGSPVARFPDIDQDQDHVSCSCYQTTEISLSSDGQDYIVHILVSGLQDMFSHQIVATQEDHVDCRWFENEPKSLLEPGHIVPSATVNTSGKAGAQIPHLPLGDDSPPWGR
jgi:hypothetical protein